MSIWDNYFHRSAPPLFVVTSCRFLLAKIHIISIIPYFHIKILIIIRLQLKDKVCCEIRARLAVKCCCLIFPIKLLNTCCWWDIKIIEHRDNIGIMSTDRSPFQRLWLQIIDSIIKILKYSFDDICIKSLCKIKI